MAGLVPFHGLNCLPAICGFFHQEPVTGKHFLQDFTVQLVVIRNKNPLAH